VYLSSGTELDLSAQYDIDSSLSVYFQGTNLTDTVYHSYGRFSNQTLNLIDYGRDYSLGIRAKF
jgi:iron complex outermembrane recepter protein